MKIFSTAYQYIFYKCFRLAWLGNRNWLNLNKEDYTYDVVWSVWLAMTVILNANIVLLVLLISVFQGFDLLNLIANSPLVCLFLFFSFSLINYFIFLYKKQYKAIIKKFEKESRKSRIIGNILVGCYVAILFPGTFIIAALLSIFHIGKGI